MPVWEERLRLFQVQLVASSAHLADFAPPLFARGSVRALVAEGRPSFFPSSSAAMPGKMWLQDLSAPRAMPQRSTLRDKRMTALRCSLTIFIRVVYGDDFYGLHFCSRLFLRRIRKSTAMHSDRFLYAGFRILC